MIKPKAILKQLKKDFSFSKIEINKGSILAVLFYGSYVKNKQHLKSDIDICIVAPECKTVKEQASMLRYFWRNVNADKYDIRLFEEFPLNIKISVIKNHKIIYTKDFSALQEYFYFCRKLWQDQSINWIGKK